MTILPFVHVAVLIACPPLLLGIINRTKSAFAGRRGPPVLQPYHDLLKLLRKGSVYSTTTTWVFQAGPIVSLAAGVAVDAAAARPTSATTVPGKSPGTTQHRARRSGGTVRSALPE